MIKLTKLVELKPLNEQEVFTATNKETGNVSVFKSKASRDAAVKSGSHEMRKDDKEDAVEKPSSKTNIFDKPKATPHPLLKNASKHDLDDMSKPFTVKVYKPGSDTYTMREFDFENIEDAQKYAEKTGGKLFKKAQEKGRFGKTVSYLKDIPSDEQPKAEPKSSSYSGNSEDMKMDMQNAFEDGYTGKGLKGVKKTKDGFQINMASYMNDNSFKDVLDSFNKTNGTNFVAGEVEKTMNGTRVTISEPKSQPSQPKRQGNPQVNKATKATAEKLGITPQKLGKEEYQTKMAQAAVAALTDANFHSEARELISKLEGKPEWAEDPRKSAPKIDSPDYDEWRKTSVYSSDYYNADDATEELGQTASQEAGWSGDDAADSIAFTLRQNGFDDLADTIQSVIKENKSTRLKDLV